MTTGTQGRERKYRLGARLLLFSLVTLVLAQQPVHGQEWDLRVCAWSNMLPYSNSDGEGIEIRLAEILSEELGAQLEYVWLHGRQARLIDRLVASGTCDMTMSVNEGNSAFLTTLAYYRSSYAFVFPSNGELRVETFDDPVLGELRLGVRAGGRGLSPVTHALANRGLLDNQVGLEPDFSSDAPLARSVEAAATGEVDLSVVWGPVAGYFAPRQPVPLEVVPVQPKFEPPFVPLVSSISIGVRRGDEALRDLLNRALVARWDDVQNVLDEYGVPREQLPAPTAGSQ